MCSSITIITTMSFKERLIEEKKNLDINIGKLSAFKISINWDTIPPIQQSLLNIQHDAMTTYAKCLNERIAWLDK